MGLNIYGDNSSYYITLTGMDTNTRYHVFVADIASNGDVNNYICRRSSLGTSGTWRYPGSGNATSGAPYKYYDRPVLVRTSTAATSHVVGNSYSYNQVISGTSFYDAQDIPAADRPVAWYGLTLSCGNGISSFKGYKVSSGSSTDTSYVRYSTNTTTANDRFYISSISPDSGYTYPIYATDGTNTWTVKTGANSWSDHYVSFSSTAGAYRGVELYATEITYYTYKITFNANRGSGAPNPVSYGPTALTQATLHIPDVTPTRDGYSFKGWALNATAGSPIVAQPDTSYQLSSSDPQIILYAQWDQLYYGNILYDLDGGSMMGSVLDPYPGPVRSRAGSGTYTDTILPVVPTKLNYTFVDWSNVRGMAAAQRWDPGDTITINCNSTSESSPTHKTIYANWTPSAQNYYGRMAFHYNYGGDTIHYGTTQSVQSITAGGYKRVTLNYQPTRTGYTFKNYNTSADGTGDSYNYNAEYDMYCSSTSESNPTNNHLYAQWTANKYTITFNANGGTPTPTPKRDDYNTTFSLTSYSNSVRRAGHTLLGWDTNQSATTPTYGINANYTITGDATLYAIWSSNQIDKFYWVSSSTDANYFDINDLEEVVLTYTHWNNLKAKIKEVAEAHGGTYNYTAVTPWEDISYSEFNDVRSAIAGLSGHGTLPSAVSYKTQLSGSQFNGSGSLKNALNTAINNL